MNIEETVSYKCCSLKKYTETSDIVVIRKAGKITIGNHKYSAVEYRNQLKIVPLDGLSEEPMSEQHL